MKIGLVLSGGGARGFAQLGALKVLHEKGIRIDAISGCSIGALIGACYAYSEDPEKIKKLLVDLKSKRDVYDYSFSTKSVIKGNKLQEYITGFFGKKDIKFEDLKIPLNINATDIVNGQEIVLNTGPLIPAIMASLSYPGFFTIRKIEDRLCVDGGVVNPLPLDLLPEVDYTIIIDVSYEKIDINEDSNMKDTIIQATLIMQKTIVDKSLERYKKQKYTLIRPDVSKVGVLQFKNAEKIIKYGEEAAEKVIDEIRKEIEK
ncbi:MAG: patatin-like phospholipase family protein [Candidatus Woesearchaeota archaeon]